MPARGIFWRDPLVRLAFLVLALVLIPYFLPFLTADQLFTYSDSYSTLPLLLLSASICIVAMRTAGRATDKRFWALWSAGQGLWLAVRILYVALPPELWNPFWDLAVDLLYVLQYLLFLFAVELRPDRRQPASADRRLRRLESIGLAVLFGGLMVYFAGIPALANRSEYDSWVPSLLLFVSLDIYLCARVVDVYLASRKTPWRPVFFWLLVTTVLWVLTDIYEALEYLEIVSMASQGTLADALWHLPLLSLILAARTYSTGPLAQTEPSTQAERTRRPFLGGTLVIGALIPPTLHVALYALGLLDESVRTPREVTVLAMLAILLALALIHQRLVERQILVQESLRRAAEDKRDLLSAAVEQAGECVVVSSPDGIVDYVNPAFESSLGYSAEEIVGRHPRILRSGTLPDQHYEELWKTIGSGEIWHGHLSFKRKDGSTRDHYTAIAPVRDASGAVVQLVATSRDVSRQARLQQQLDNARRMEALGTLAGGIAHDFNNVLLAIVGYAELLQLEIPDGTRNKNHVQMILDAADRAANLVRKFVSFASQSDPARHATSVKELLEEAKVIITDEMPRGVVLQTRVEPEAGKILADPHQIQQLLGNLANNAFDAMGGKPGIVKIVAAPVNLTEEEAESLDGVSAGAYVRISVRDPGRGMAPETLQRIFEPFFTTKDFGTGSGLGMSVVHGIARSHDGKVNVESREGAGTTVEVFFPRLKEAPDATEQRFNTAPDSKSSPRLLVVDDEVAIAELLQHHLIAADYLADVAHSGEEAKEKIAGDPLGFSAVITDQTMPGMTGLQLAKGLRLTHPTLPVILMSGSSDPMTPQRLDEVGIQFFLPKPFSTEQLLDTVAHALTLPVSDRPELAIRSTQ